MAALLIMRKTVKAIRDKKLKKEKIVSLTAYDYPLARILDEQEVDIILVGDSLGMVLLGYNSTVPVTMRDMLHHTKAVSRGVTKAMVVADMPFASYGDPQTAVRNAKRLVQLGGADAIKLEGGLAVEKQVTAILKAGIPVMGHLGMTPQSASQFGGYRVQGKAAKDANRILSEAKLLDRLGVFAIVLECVPSALAGKITRAVDSPTVGIGAGDKTDGQILVSYDMLGYEGAVRPKFVRRYADLQKSISKAVKAYRQDVVTGKFPSKEESF